MNKEPQNTATQPEPEKKNDIASRAIIAATFGGLIATKVNNIGTIMDADNILKGRNLTFKQKIGSIFNGDLFRELPKKIKSTMENENKGFFTALAKVSKYTLITGAIGGAAGAAVGWSRGGLIDNWKDIFKSPWQSTKIIIGIEKPDSQKETAKAEQTTTENIVVNTPKNTEQTDSKNWQNYAKEREQASSTTRII